MSRSYHAKFYVPVIVLWGSVMLSTLDPELIQSDIRYDPYVQRNDLLRIDPGGNVGVDALIIARLNRIDYVARVIGLGGDEITLGLDGNSIIRNGERVILAPRGREIASSEPPAMTVGDGQAAVYVHSGRRNPFIVIIGGDAIRGTVERVYRYSDLGRSEWLTIGFYSLIVLALFLLPYATFMRQSRPSFVRLVVLVTHTFLALAIAAALFVASLSDGAARPGVVEPIWWWFPLAVVAGFRLKLLFVVALFLAIQWLGLNRPWRRQSARPIK